MGEICSDLGCRRRALVLLPMTLALSHARAADVPPCRVLLVGNGKYARNALLPNTGNDVRLLERALGGVGARVETQFDLTQRQLDVAFGRFFDQVRSHPENPVWISFAGHAVQIEGKNYLQGVDSDFSSPERVRAAGYDLDEMLFKLQEAGPVAAVVTLDACRNNPFKPEMTRGASSGLAPAEATGVLVGFSTAPYMRALDGPVASTSPYARALADALAQRPATLEQVFQRAADAVYRSTGHQQVPEYRSSLRTEWRFAAKQVELVPLPIGDASKTTAAQGPSRGSNYRPDLAASIDSTSTAMTPDQWAIESDRLRNRADHTDTREARLLLARGRTAGALPADITLAAILLEAGRTMPRDRLAAKDLYEQAAARGYAIAQMLLGELHYERGEYPAAYKWLSAATDRGLLRARLDLAQMKFEGRGSSADIYGAIDLLKQSLPSTVPTVEDRNRALDLMRAFRGDAAAPRR